MGQAAGRAANPDREGCEISGHQNRCRQPAHAVLPFLIVVSDVILADLRRLVAQDLRSGDGLFGHALQVLANRFHLACRLESQRRFSGGNRVRRCSAAGFGKGAHGVVTFDLGKCDGLFVLVEGQMHSLAGFIGQPSQCALRFVHESKPRHHLVPHFPDLERWQECPPVFALNQLALGLQRAQHPVSVAFCQIAGLRNFASPHRNLSVHEEFQNAKSPCDCTTHRSPLFPKYRSFMLNPSPCVGNQEICSYTK